MGSLFQLKDAELWMKVQLGIVASKGVTSLVLYYFCAIWLYCKRSNYFYAKLDPLAVRFTLEMLNSEWVSPWYYKLAQENITFSFLMNLLQFDCI